MCALELKSISARDESNKSKKKGLIEEMRRRKREERARAKAHLLGVDRQRVVIASMSELNEMELDDRQSEDSRGCDIHK